MDGIIVDSFNVTSIEKVYEQVKHTVQINNIRWVVIAIATCLVISNFIKEYKKLEDGSEHVDMKMMTGFFREYVVAITVIALLPILLTAIESTLSVMQQNFINNAGIPADNWATAVKKLAEDKGVDPEGPSIIPNPMAWIDYWTARIINPIFYWCNKYIYSLFMVGRYFYLLMLEIVSPVAIVMLLSSDTKHFFFSWLKNMLFCYCMIPFFLLANNFADTVINSMFTGEITIWFALLTSFILKLSLFKVVNSKLHNLL